MTKDDSSPALNAAAWQLRWIGTVAVALAVVGAAYVLADAFRDWVQARYYHNTVQVTGSATSRIRSDRAVWRATVIARGPVLVDAYHTIAQGTPRVIAFLREQGIPEAEIESGAVQTEEIYAQNEDGVSLQNQIATYALQQQITVTSADLEKVTRVSQRVTQLLEQGVDVRSGAPEYLYTQLGELKLQLISEATNDARTRAQRVAERSGSTLGALETARVGVVQINAANESEVSWEGVYDRTAIDKDAMVTVTTTFFVR